MILRWVGRLRTVGIQRGTQQQVEDVTADTSEFELSHHSSSRRSHHQHSHSHQHPHQHSHQHHQHHHRHHRSGSSISQFDEHDMMLLPFLSGSSSSSTVWGSIPSTPGGGTFTPPVVYAGSSSPGGTTSIPIGAMSLASRYSTPRSGILTLPDEEEEEQEGEGEEEGEEGAVVGMMRKKDRKKMEKEEGGGGGGQVRVIGVDSGMEGEGEEEEDRLQKMDVDV